jgi:hypothetical protein
MKLRPRRYLLRNVIILSHPDFTSLPPFLPMHGVEEPGQEVDSFLENRFPNAKLFVFLPNTFISVITALVNNMINSSICHQTLLQHLGLQCSRDNDPIEWEDLSIEQSANYYCIIVIVCHYIIIASNSHTEGDEEKLQLSEKTIKAKRKWSTQRLHHLRDEQYLGTHSFAIDLSRPCGEFYLELKQAWWFKPIHWSFFK